MKAMLRGLLLRPLTTAVLATGSCSAQAAPHRLIQRRQHICIGHRRRRASNIGTAVANSHISFAWAAINGTHSYTNSIDALGPTIRTAIVSFGGGCVALPATIT